MKNKDHVEARLKVALLKKQKITPLIALRRWKCFRLAVYVNRLRNRGMSIKTEIIRKNGYTFAQYSV